MGRRINRSRREKHLCKGRYVKYPDLMADGEVVVPGVKYYLKEAHSSKRKSGSYFKVFSMEEIYNVTRRFHKYKLDGEIFYA